MLLYIFHTTYHTATPYLGSPVLCFPEFLFSCNCILCILQASLLPFSLFTSPYSLLLLMGAALSLHNARWCLLSPLFIPFWTLSLFVSPLPTSKASRPLFLNLLPSHFPCIIQLPNTLNLLTTIFFFFCSSLLLQFQARCLNLPCCLHSFSSFPSSSALNLVRACLWLSMSLMRVLYCSRDIVLYSRWIICEKKRVCIS